MSLEFTYGMIAGVATMAVFFFLLLSWAYMADLGMKKRQKEFEDRMVDRLTKAMKEGKVK